MFLALVQQKLAKMFRSRFGKVYFVVLFIIELQKISSAVITSSDVNTSGCQEFHTRADKYVNFFALNSIENEALDDEIFRYKFLVKGDRDIYILFTETDYAQSGSKCYEFGISASNPPAATFRTAIDGSLRVRTEEKVALSSKMPLQVVIISKEEGDVQMYVGNNSYPIIRFPENVLQQKFVSFATRGNVLAQFYFNCGIEQKQAESAQRDISPQEAAKPVVYISFDIKSLSRELETVSVDLNYNMTVFTNEKSSTFTSSTNVKDVGNTKSEIPKLTIFSNHLELERTSPKYKSSLYDDNKLTIITNEHLKMSCKDELLGLLYCNLAFGLDDDTYHLKYIPNGPLFGSGLAAVADIKVYQAENSFSKSLIPLKGDIDMIFKIDSLKF